MKYTVAYKKLKNDSIVAMRFEKTKRSASGRRGELKSAHGLAFDDGALKSIGRRALIRSLISADGIHGDDTLSYVDSGRLYYGGTQIPGITLAACEKTILKLGKYLMVFPDGVYTDLDTGDFGNMSLSFDGVNVNAYPVNEKSEKISCVSVSKEPTDALAGTYYAIKDGRGEAVIKYFDGSVFCEISLRFKLVASGIGSAFRSGDVIQIFGLKADTVRCARVLSAEADALVCNGYLPEHVSGKITVKRSIPDFDFVTVSGGRLVGVKRGRDKNGTLVSKIYASAEGEPFNFEVGFGGMELDVDINGSFTAVCDYLGSPLAFTESEIIETRIKNGALICTVIKTDGVEKGAHKSIACGGGELYYKSRRGICRYDGSYPELISDGEGDWILSENGSPAAFAYGKYYVQLKTPEGQTKICVYDTRCDSITTESDFGVKSFAVRGASLYAIFEGETGCGLMLMDYDSATENERNYLTSEGYPRVIQTGDWSFETGEMVADDFGTLRPVKAVLRLKKPEGSTASVDVIYNGEEIVSSGEVSTAQVSGAMQIPIILKRCESFRLKVSGSGSCTVYGYALQFKEGGVAGKWR